MSILVKIVDSRLENSDETFSFRNQCNYTNALACNYERYLSKKRVFGLKDRIFLREVNKMQSSLKLRYFQLF